MMHWPAPYPPPAPIPTFVSPEIMQAYSVCSKLTALVQLTLPCFLLLIKHESCPHEFDWHFSHLNDVG